MITNTATTAHAHPTDQSAVIAHLEAGTPVTVTEVTTIRWARLADGSWIPATHIDIEPADSIHATPRQPGHHR